VTSRTPAPIPYDRKSSVYVSVSSRGFDRDETIEVSGPGCLIAARQHIERFAEKLCGELAKELLAGDL